MLEETKHAGGPNTTWDKFLFPCEDQRQKEGAGFTDEKQLKTATATIGKYEVRQKSREWTADSS